MVLKNNKKFRIFISSSASAGEDKISNLPDALIHHILSFLPTKWVMSTCILSKRWKYLSNSIPTLDFRDWQALDCTAEEKHLKAQQFMDFLDTVFYLHEKPIIQKFCVRWDRHFDQSRVNKWISFLIKRKVEELFLSVPSQTTFKLPLSLFTCDSLTVLDLGNIRLNVPNSVCFPRLKLLRLRQMEFVNGISIEKLFSNCPILEELSLIHCRGLESEVLCISNLALKILYMSYCNFGESTVKICAPNLSTINFSAEVPADFVFDSFPSLGEAVIDMYNYGPYPAKTLVISKLFECISNVKILKMSGDFFLDLLSKVDILTDLPAFNNLIHLEVGSELDCASFSSNPVSTMKILFRLLQLTPNVESIVFAKSIHIPDKKNDGCWSLDPKCSLTHLKSINFNVFYGEPMELNAIKLFLEYAGVLETVTIVAAANLSNDYEKQTNVMKLLLMLPKPANCVVKFLTGSGNS